MSVDLNVYIREPSRFSVRDCEAYLDALGLHGHFEPDFDVMTASGFVPFVFKADLIGDGVLYRDGFEFYIDPIEKAPEGGTARKTSFWGRIFGKKSGREQVSEDPFSWANYSILFSCSGADGFSVLLALGVGAYMASACGGVLHDPQSDVIYETASSIGQQFAVCLEEVRLALMEGNLCLHREER